MFIEEPIYSFFLVTVFCFFLNLLILFSLSLFYFIIYSTFFFSKSLITLSISSNSLFPPRDLPGTFHPLSQIWICALELMHGYHFGTSWHCFPWLFLLFTGSQGFGFVYFFHCFDGVHPQRLYRR